jgi:hypothetical protein
MSKPQPESYDWDYRKQIEINYEAQISINLMLKDEVEKKLFKKKLKSIWVNLKNLLSR